MPLHIRWCPLLAVAAFGLLGSVSCSGNMSLQFLQFSSDGLTLLGSACDGGPGDPCDPQFRVTADKSVHGGQGLFIYQQIGHYSNQNDITFASAIGEASNPLMIHMNYDDNFGSLRLTVYVTDYDTGSTGQLMSKFTAELIASGTETRELELSSGTHRLRLKYWYACNAYYYGSLCNINCKPSDDSADGHFWCGTGGGKVCRFGWVDASTDCKKPHPCRTCVCPNGGTCAPEGDGYTCVCPTGYSGSKCETCSSSSGCSSSATTCNVPDYSATEATPSSQPGLCFGLSAFVPVAAVACLGAAGTAILAVVLYLERKRAD